MVAPMATRCARALPAVLIAALAAPGCGGPSAGGARLDGALAAARADGGKVVFVEFGAKWCGPCKRLAKTTLADDRVRAWLDERAVQLHVDIDDDPELATEFGVRSVPTMLFLRPDRTELGRIVGFREVEPLLAEAEQRLRGVPASEESAARVEADPKDMMARLDSFRDLRAEGRHWEALEAAEAYWQMSREHMAQAGVRTSFFLNDMADVARDSETAQKMLERWLQEAQARLQSKEGKPTAMMEVVALARQLDRPELVFEVAEQLEGSFSLRMLTTSCGDLFVEHQRYAMLVDSGVCELPLVRQRLSMLAFGAKAMASDPTMRRTRRKANIDAVAVPFEALAGVGRDEDALAIAALVLGEEDDAEVRARLAAAADRAGNAALMRRVRETR